MADDQTRLVISIDTILRNLDRTLKGLSRVEKQLLTITNLKSGTGISAGFDKAAAASQRLQLKQDRLIVQSRELANRQERARQTAERLARAQERLSKAASTATLAKAADAHVKEFRARELAARRVAKEVERINNETRRQAERNARILERAETQLANHRIRETQRAARAAARANEQVRLGVRRGDGGGGAFFGGSLLGFAGAGPAASALGVGLGLTIFNLTSRLTEGASAWVDYASKIENARIAFSTMLGGVVDADKHLRDLQKFALETPFAFDELVEASQRMQALGFRAEEVIPVLRDVGNAVAAAGGGNERLERVIKALSDVRARGTLQSQEIRQFAEAGISAFQILREETGKTTQELQDMLEKGQISADFFLAAFRKFSQTRFGDLMQQQSRTFTGAMSNIRDVLLQTAATSFEPLFKKISEIAVRVQAELQKTTELRQTADVLAQAFFELGGFIGEKIIEGIGASLASPQFLSQFGSFGSRLAASFLRGFGSSLRATIAEAITGQPPGTVTAGDLMRADAQRLTQLKSLSAAGAENARVIQQQAESQSDAAEITKKLNNIYQNLRDTISDVSSVSQFLATKQALLRAGVTDLTSGYAALALKLAAVSDAFRELEERTRAEAERISTRNKGLRDQLEQLRDSTRLALAELQAEPEGLTELERFNFTVGSQVEGVLESARAAGEWSSELEGLAEALKLTREQLAQLDVELASKRAREEAKKILEMRQDTIRSLSELQRDLFRGLRGDRTTEIEQVADQIERISSLKIPVGGLDSLVKLLRETPTEIPAALERVQQILSTVRGDLGPEFDRISQAIVNALSDAGRLDAQLAATAERTASLDRLFLGLRIEEARVQDRILDGALSEREGRDAILQLQREYREEILKVLEVELALARTRKDPSAILNIQAQIEEVERMGRVIDEVGREINRSLLADIQSGLEGIFQGARNGIEGLKDALIDFGESILDTFNRIASESITRKLEGIFKPDSGDTAGTPGGFLAKLFGLTPQTSALTTAATAAGTAISTGGATAGAAMSAGGATAAATLATSVTAAAATFAAAVTAAGAAFAAAVATSAGVDRFAGLGGNIGFARGNIIQPRRQGVLARIAEAGHAEAVLTTDPKYAARQARILTRYLRETKGLFGRFRIPEFAEGTFISPQQAEMNLLSGISRPMPLSSLPESALTISSDRPALNFRNINLFDRKAIAHDYLRSAEGARDILNIVSENGDEIGRRLGLK